MIIIKYSIFSDLKIGRYKIKLPEVLFILYLNVILFIRKPAFYIYNIRKKSGDISSNK